MVDNEGMARRVLISGGMLFGSVKRGRDFLGTASTAPPTGPGPSPEE